MTLVAEGPTDDEISQLLCISRATEKPHVNRMMLKLAEPAT